MSADLFAPLYSHDIPPKYRFLNSSGWQPGSGDSYIPVVSPVDGAVIGEVPQLTKSELNELVITAGRLSGSWAATPIYRRIKIMHLAADWLRHEQEYLTSLLVREIGKTYADAKSEIIRSADLIDYFAQETQTIHGETLDSDAFPGFDKGKIAMVERVSHGVVLAIGPFNYPVNLAVTKIVPALLMGNTVIFKPATQGSISGLHLVRLLQKAGVPDGVVTTATGSGREVGLQLAPRPEISLVAFTGSSQTGKEIARLAAMKPLVFECGGNSAAVVLPDADLQLASREIIRGAFAYAGQRCTAVKYVLATPAILANLVPLVQKTLSEEVQMGDPRSPQTRLVGPVISDTVAAEIESVIHESLHQGARLVAGGKRRGRYIEPTIFTNVTANMTVIEQEIFGPVLSFVSVLSWGEAANIVNNSRYGLQASVFTRDEGAGIAFAQTLNVGSVQINSSPQRGPDNFPFLGVRDSGVGVQGVRYSLEAMSRIKPIILNKPA